MGGNKRTLAEELAFRALYHFVGAHGRAPLRLTAGLASWGDSLLAEVGKDGGGAITLGRSGKLCYKLLKVGDLGFQFADTRLKLSLNLLGLN